jgi:polar amino acid transport system substrate-binding protein
MFCTATRAAALGLLVLVCAAPPGAAAELRLVTGSWCPFECAEQEADGLKGYLNELAAAILAADGSALHFVATSYLRGIEMVSSGQADLLVGIAREDAPTLVYPELEQGITGHTFFVKAGNPWRYRGPDSPAELAKIGAMQGYDYAEFNAFIARNPHKIELLPGVHRTRRTIQRLIAGRVDAIIADANVIEFQLKRMDRVGALVPAGSLAAMQSVYIAVSPQLPAARELAQRLSRGTARLRESGELAAILQRYGLRDWKR